jgi:hypothetical protein
MRTRIVSPIMILSLTVDAGKALAGESGIVIEDELGLSVRGRVRPFCLDTVELHPPLQIVLG